MLRGQGSAGPGRPWFHHSPIQSPGLSPEQKNSFVPFLSRYRKYRGFPAPVSGQEPGDTGKIFAVSVVFMRSKYHVLCMDIRLISLLICITAVSVAGCTTNSAGPSVPPASPATLPAATPAVTVSPIQSAECTVAEDCVPAQCCHPTSCTAVAAKKPCNLMCTNVCQGPLDCGAGTCGCVQGKCSIVPAPVPPVSPALTSLAINASPSRYSPAMSSTPGIGLEPVPAGFSAGNASFAWKASYGHFLSWDAPGYQINEQGDSLINHGGKIYWSFTGRPDLTATPVTITVTATDPASGRLLGSSVTTLDWADNFSVVVRGAE
jgi:hypothetical protein